MAQSDTVGVVAEILQLYKATECTKHNSFPYEARLQTIDYISGECDSLFYVKFRSLNDLSLNSFDAKAFKERLYLIYFNKKTGRLISASTAHVEKENCTHCNRKLQGFIFGDQSFSHIPLYCPEHRMQNEIWEHYKD